jgi:hypothetical protein
MPEAEELDYWLGVRCGTQSCEPLVAASVALEYLRFPVRHPHSAHWY